MQAFVNEILAKSVKDGAMTMYDYVLSDGNKVGAGKFKLKGIEAGDYIEYEFTNNGNFKNFKPGSVSKLDKPAGVTPPSAAPNFVPSGDKRQETISKQAAVNTALAFTTLLASQDALPIPKTAKSSEKADLIQEVVDHYTGHFYKQATGQDMAFADKAPAAKPGEARSAMEAAESGDNWVE